MKTFQRYLSSINKESIVEVLDLSAAVLDHLLARFFKIISENGWRRLWTWHPVGFAEFCICALLDACRKSRTCLVDVQRAIWRSWYDPVQRTMMVKSALIDLDIHGKVASLKALISWRQQRCKPSIPAQAILRLHYEILICIIHFTQCPQSLFSQGDQWLV